MTSYALVIPSKELKFHNLRKCFRLILYCLIHAMHISVDCNPRFTYTVDAAQIHLIVTLLLLLLHRQ
jgi:hypothetical protein